MPEVQHESGYTRKTWSAVPSRLELELCVSHGRLRPVSRQDYDGGKPLSRKDLKLNGIEKFIHTLFWRFTPKVRTRHVAA